MGQPLFKKSQKELESCLATLYRMLDNIHDYDGMEIANYMSCRDDAQLAIEQLNGNIDLSPYLEKLTQLDEKICKNVQYISESMDSHFVRNYFKSHVHGGGSFIVAQTLRVPFVVAQFIARSLRQ